MWVFMWALCGHCIFSSIRAWAGCAQAPVFTSRRVFPQTGFQGEKWIFNSVRPCPVLVHVPCPCLVFVRISRKILSGVCLLSGFCPDFLSGVCLSGQTRTRQSCPDFCCPCPPTSVSNEQSLGQEVQKSFIQIHPSVRKNYFQLKFVFFFSRNSL